MRPGWESNPRIRVLQTLDLPLVDRVRRLILILPCLAVGSSINMQQYSFTHTKILYTMITMYWSNTAEFVIFLMRIGFGWMIAWDGYTKLTSHSWSLLPIIDSAHTLPNLYTWLSHPAHIGVANIVIPWALLVVGVSLILGLWVRVFGFVGIGIFLMYYFAGLQFPRIITGEYIVNTYIIYCLLLILLIVARSGNFWGLDSRVEVRVR